MEMLRRLSMMILLFFAQALLEELKLPGDKGLPLELRSLLLLLQPFSDLVAAGALTTPSPPALRKIVAQAFVQLFVRPDETQGVVGLHNFVYKFLGFLFPQGIEVHRDARDPEQHQDGPPGLVIPAVESLRPLGFFRLLLSTVSWRHSWETGRHPGHPRHPWETAATGETRRHLGLRQEPPHPSRGLLGPSHHPRRRYLRD
mmetsp:Transcript_4011/g.9452  ORF Transcript_4011/g.9452 Transcript_4011/m.9452 type:complete len:201 (+) Transcript_4011:2178-2780(+)